MAEAQTEAEQTKFVTVLIPKAKQSLEVDLSQLPEEVWSEVVNLGLKSLLTRGMTEIKTTGLEGKALETAQHAAFEVAQGNLEKMYSGEIRLTTTKRVKVKGKERTRALQKAKNIVKAQMKAEGLKISHYSAKEITMAAESVLEDNPELIAEARAELEAEEKQTAKVKISLKDKMKADPKKVQAAKEKAAAAKAATAAKKRAKGEGAGARA